MSYMRSKSVRRKFDEYFSELTPPCEDILCPRCRIKECDYVYKENGNEHNVFFLTHKVDRDHFPNITDMCDYIECIYKHVQSVPKFEERCKEYERFNPNCYNWDSIPCNIEYNFQYMDEFRD